MTTEKKTNQDKNQPKAEQHTNAAPKTGPQNKPDMHKKPGDQNKPTAQTKR